MPHWRTLQERDYLGAWDLVGKDGKPRDFTLEIASVKSGLLKTRETPKGKRKIVIRFVGAAKGFACNTTNAETIESLHGPDVDAWIGKLITLYPTTTKSPKGGTVPCIRVRPRAPAAGAKAEELGAGQPVDPEMRAAQDAAFDRPAREPGED